MIEGKIWNSRTLLRRNSRTAPGATIDQLRELAVAAASPPGYPSLLGLEGTAARLYLQRFTGMPSSSGELDVDGFGRNGRVRRPPPDPVNALLSFVYALLVKDLTVTLRQVGFAPYVGVFHRPRCGRPALALDLAEEFRPLVADSTVVQVINNGEVRPPHFTRRAGGCQLDRAAAEPFSPTSVEWRRRSSPSSATASPLSAPPSRRGDAWPNGLALGRSAVPSSTLFPQVEALCLGLTQGHWDVGPWPTCRELSACVLLLVRARNRALTSHAWIANLEGATEGAVVHGPAG
jgi:hypothetical protein